MASEREQPKGVDPYGRVTIQVGEKRFTTLLDTLTDESEYFRSTFSRWDENVIQEDGVYFYDGDPVIFAHILQYLRRRVLPVFYDNNRGHNHALYSTLLAEAKYLQIDRLVKWLEQKKYLEAVKVTCGVERRDTPNFSIEKATFDGEMTLIPPLFTTRMLQKCPRLRIDHMSKETVCRMSPGCDRYDHSKGKTEYVEVGKPISTVILTKTEIDHDMCCTWEPEE